MLILSIKENEKVYLLKDGKKLGYVTFKRHRMQRTAIFVHCNDEKESVIIQKEHLVKVKSFDLEVMLIAFNNSYIAKLGFQADQSIRIIRQVLYEKENN